MCISLCLDLFIQYYVCEIYLYHYNSYYFLLLSSAPLCGYTNSSLIWISK